MRKIKTIYPLILAVLVTAYGYAQSCGPMSYPSGICAGSSTSVTGSSVSGALSYRWILFGAASGTSFANNVTLTPSNTLITGSSQSGSLSWDVKAFNQYDGYGTQVGYCSGALTVSQTPNTPASLTGSSTLCIEQAKTYTCTSTSGATYTWEVTSIGFSQTTGSNSLYLSGDNFSSTGSYTLRVRTNNSCGSSGWKTKSISVISGCPPY